MPRLVRTEACQCRFIEFVSVGNQQLQRFRHGHDVMENAQIRSQIMVLESFCAVRPACFPPVAGRLPTEVCVGYKVEEKRAPEISRNWG